MVRSHGSNRIIGIGNRQKTGFHRNAVTPQAGGIAAAIIVFMVVQYGGQAVHQIDDVPQYLDGARASTS